ncbi:ATP-dependent DNA helicase Q1 [Gallus gallus]|uniref:ATP-dependent DNA helicase n=1 Tax=Gallus gallus TaxID=9031 RepID=F1NPI7_CHICK|nr:ATP-dependent DNA helicase Q1 [Gallus gallus]XP_015145461.1 ATP-dependent DNA helicase Q1 isoform X1 [Gallus gallus]XP_015145472.1 ATP-dependent DNA helicase Q1 isoform X1 [Gallus gallus]|eukprot:XP_015145461.1 ATP-dependent DNA helicase Q1 isoform X1 [Gallus gallus]
MTAVEVLEEELLSIENELQAVEMQIQELLDKQQELIQKKTTLKKLIKQSSGESAAGGSKETETSVEAWNRTDFPWYEKIKTALQNKFKLPKFRSLQLETVNATMAGKDIFLVMPTGGGKSLCYQLPAVCSDGFTLVICPLISLMEDQLMVLDQLGISATLLNASSSKEHVKWVHAQMLDRNSQLKLLYVTPEKIAKSKMFMSKLEKAYQAGCLARIAVDEVHCCSQWGHDFRPDYKSLGILKRQFPCAPLIGLTATATNHVLKDAQNILHIQKCITFTASFNRPNLYYEVRHKPSNNEDFIEDIVKLINGRYKGLSGIVYCFSQKDSEQVTVSLQKLGIKAGTYHANMDAKYKTKVHKGWAANQIQVVVATVAFGMGIDKPDVRFVIHHSMSKSMENYYQESGRAGRDDQKADCILYYGFGDIFRISSMVVMENVGQEKLYDMVSYCQNMNKCRRVLIARHFDEVWESANCNRMCDNCCRENSLEKKDITGYYRDLIKILEQADNMSEKLTPLKLIDAWSGKGLSKLRVAEVTPPKLPREELERIIAHLLLQQYLREDFSFTAFATISYLKIGPKAGLLRNEAHIITIQGTTNKKSIHRNKPSESSNSEGSTENAQTVSKPTPDSAVKKSQDRKRHNCGTNFKAKKPKLQAGGDDQPVVLD